MRKIIATVIGFLLGLGIGLSIKHQRIAAGGIESMHTTSFMVWTVMAFVMAAVFAVVAAKWEWSIFVGITATFLAIGLIWGLG